MKCLLIVLLVGVSASWAAPSGLLGLGGYGLGAYGLGGYGLGGAIVGAPYGATLLAAPAGVSVQKTYVTSPAVIATGPAIAAPAIVAAAPAVVAAAPAAATSAVVAGPSGVIASKQVNPGGVAAIAAAPYTIGYGGYGYGH